MPITTAMPTAAKVRWFRGELAAGDTYKAALFTNAASLDAATTAYTTSGEITGTGYVAGGATLTGFATGSSGTTAWIDFTTDPSWTTATFTARGMMIYNDTASPKTPIAIIDFGGDQSVTAGTFTIVFPTADASNALIRFL